MADNARVPVDRLDETIEETFPASDAPANTVETGIRIAPTAAAESAVSDNRQASRFELTINRETAFLVYERTEETLTLVHTEVPSALRGQHIGDRLVEAALAAGHAAGLRIVAVCPFVRAYLRKRHEPAE
jgi:predicted GNAT family acetyltransferase